MNHLDIIGKEDLPTDAALRRIYGENTQFSRIIGNGATFTLVHLDNPTDDEINKRVQGFNVDEFFFDDCPLCAQSKKEGGYIIFDGDPLDSEEAADERIDDIEPSLAMLQAFDEFNQAVANIANEEDFISHHAGDALNFLQNLTSRLPAAGEYRKGIIEAAQDDIAAVCYDFPKRLLPLEEMAQDALETIKRFYGF